MQAATSLQFQQRPSLSGLVFTMLRNAGPRAYQLSQALALRASWQDARIDAAHARAFHDACGFAPQDGISLLYPMTLVYPPMLYMLSQRAAPLPLFKVLNTRMQIRQYRPLSVQERGQILLRVADVRKAEKGLELDVDGGFETGGSRAWECRATFFYRGPFEGTPGPAAVEGGFCIGQAAKRQEWRIPARGRFRFGQLCGDTNPIHYGRLWARALGFERDFAQPLLVVGQALSRVPALSSTPPLRLEARFKGPVYYERKLQLVMQEDERGGAFEIYCAPNDRPSICVSFNRGP